MEYKVVESINREVSRIALGTWAIGGWLWGGADDDESIKTIHAALDKGVNFIDTAPVYGFGRAEKVVGKALARSGNRENITIMTKVGLEWKGQNVRRNSSRERIFKEIDDSLERLGTDYIDIYVVHWPDSKVPAEETASALNELFEQRKIRAIGVSNYSVKEMDEFREYAPIQVMQPPYNMFEREIEDDIKEYCENHNIALTTYGALCRGLLTGKMRKDTKFEGDDLRKMDPKFDEEHYAQYLEAVDRLDRFARENFNKSVLQLAVRWILDKGIDVTIWGARRPDQVADMDSIDGWSLDKDSLEEVDRIINETISDPVGPEFMAPPD